MSINQIRTWFDEQQHITNDDSAFDIIISNDKFKCIKLEVVKLKHPDNIHLPRDAYVYNMML